MWAALDRFWQQVWFQSKLTVTLDLVRIGVAAAVLINYGGLSGELFNLYSEQGWVSLEVVREYYRDNPFAQSLLLYFTQPWQLLALYSVTLLAALALLVGWQTRWVKWIVLIGHISFVHRNPMIMYGVDNILASLLFLSCLAPIGLQLSLDRVRQIRRAKQHELNMHPAPQASAWGFAMTRLIQLQMAVFFFFAGVEKLRGVSWWNGDALWIALTNYEYTNVSLDLFAHQYWLINLMTYFTVLVELAYPFLIWGRRTRPYLLIAALTLHVGIGVLMGLYLFSFVMCIGHLAFLRPEWLAKVGRRYARWIGGMEMIYDGDCGFCKRSMAWLLGFDGLRQISLRDYRRDPSPVVPSEQVDKALYVVLSSGRALPGFDAYRHVVIRVPGLWWMALFFYIPFLSAWIGRRVYAWVAAHRDVISTCMIDGRPNATVSHRSASDTK